MIFFSLMWGFEIWVLSIDYLYNFSRTFQVFFYGNFVFLGAVIPTFSVLARFGKDQLTIVD